MPASWSWASSVARCARSRIIRAERCGIARRPARSSSIVSSTVASMPLPGEAVTETVAPVGSAAACSRAFLSGMSSNVGSTRTRAIAARSAATMAGIRFAAAVEAPVAAEEEIAANVEALETGVQTRRIARRRPAQHAAGSSAPWVSNGRQPVRGPARRNGQMPPWPSSGDSKPRRRCRVLRGATSGRLEPRPTVVSRPGARARDLGQVEGLAARIEAALDVRVGERGLPLRDVVEERLVDARIDGWRFVLGEHPLPDLVGPLGRIE